jgi:hypothetical protein
MPKNKKLAGNAVRLSVSVSKEEKQFLDENQYSASKLLHWAIEQKGFKEPVQK